MLRHTRKQGRHTIVVRTVRQYPPKLHVSLNGPDSLSVICLFSKRFSTVCRRLLLWQRPSLNLNVSCRTLICRLFNMVARSSVARARLPLYFTAVYLFIYLFFSRHTLSEVRKPTSPKLSHTMWLSIQQNLCYRDFFKVPLKRMGVEKNKICTILMRSRRQLAP